jgi:hypothetical protein
VLDFRRNRTDRFGQQRRQGRRLLVTIILLLGLVIVAIDRARQPGAWAWFDSLSAPSAEESGPAIDNRLDAVAPRDSAPDSFVIPKEQRAEKAADQDKYFPGVKPEWFATIHDDTISSRGEQACTFALLDILQRSDLEKLRKASLGRIAYAQLFRQPNEYRGRLVTVSGRVHAVHRIELFKNEYGIKEYYQVWLAPFENRTSPIVVYCLGLPKGFPTGKKVAEEAEVTGFFLKRWAYQATDAVRTAPELLAKTLEWRKRPLMRQESPGGIGSLLLIVAAAIVVAAATAWLIYIRTRSPRLVSPDRPPGLENIRLADEPRNNAKER